MSKKMRDRIRLCRSVDVLGRYIDESNREHDMGGTWTHDHAAFIKVVDDMQHAYSAGDEAGDGAAAARDSDSDKSSNNYSSSNSSNKMAYV